MLVKIRLRGLINFSKGYETPVVRLYREEFNETRGFKCLGSDVFAGTEMKVEVSHSLSEETKTIEGLGYLK